QADDPEGHRLGDVPRGGDGRVLPVLVAAAGDGGVPPGIGARPHRLRHHARWADEKAAARPMTDYQPSGYPSAAHPPAPTPFEKPADLLWGRLPTALARL